MLNVALILLTLSWAWLLVFDRAETCSLLARDWIYTLSLVATLWLLAMTLIAGPPLLMAMLKLPCLFVLIIAAWQGLRRTWTAWQAVGLELSTGGERVPRMSEHELDGLYQDLAKVGRLRASGRPHELVRARELHALIVEQAAAPASKGY